MTDARDLPDEDEESGGRIDEVQPVSSALRPAQSHWSELDASESNAEQTTLTESEEANSEDTDELDELTPVSSSLRPGQGRVQEEDAQDGGDGDD